MEKEHHLPLPVRILIWILAVGIILYGLLIGYVWIRERSVRSEVPENYAYEAIIVLGAQIRPDGTPSVQLTWRLDKAKEAYDLRKVPIVVCGAQGKDEPMTEAEGMKRYLISVGVPESDILMDPASFNTRQNLLNAWNILNGASQPKRVLVVTSDYHVPRALALAQDAGFTGAEGLGSPCLPEYWIRNHAREALAWAKYWGMKYLHLPLE